MFVLFSREERRKNEIVWVCLGKKIQVEDLFIGQNYKLLYTYKIK